MIIFAILALILLVSCAIEWQFMFEFALILTIVFIVALPISHMTASADIAAFNAMKTTVINSRAENSIERAALVLEISKKNQWLARNKFYRDGPLRLWIPPKIDSLEYIQ
jgi:hypothetical protein